jgi:ATP-binding cassette subfamily F protein 3
LRATCDELWLVADGKVTPFDGDLDDYAEWLAQDRAAEKKGGGSRNSANQKPAPAAAKPVSHEPVPAVRRPLLKESEKLEQQLAEWQGELKLLETRLADQTLYSSPETRLLEELTLRQALLTQNIETAEARWLEIHELLESTEEN